MLEKPDLSLHSRLAIQLRLAEKQILEKTSAFGRAKRLLFQEKLEEGAALPQFEESDIALLENNDSNAKLPIILRKLEEVEEGRGVQAGEHLLLNGEKSTCEAGTETNGDAETEETRKKDVRSADGPEQKEQTETADLGANRTEDPPKESSE